MQNGLYDGSTVSPYSSQRDPEALRQMLILQLPTMLRNVQDWTSSGCLNVTLLAVDVARRVAANLATELLKLENFVVLRGHESEFDLQARTVSRHRLLQMALTCAQLLTSPQTDAPRNAPMGEESEVSEQWKLPLNVRRQSPIIAYYHEVQARSQSTVFTFQTLLEYRGLSAYNLEHVHRAAYETPAACCRLFGA